jgi:hypothetical protein
MEKMQNHIISFFFALLLLLSGCVGSIIDNDVRDTSIPDMTVKIDSCITIKVEDFDGRKPYNVENVIDSVSFIKLTTEDEAILGAIDQIILMDTCLLVRDTYKTKSVKMFSMSGQFLHTIGRIGQGPGEYVEPTYMGVIENKIAIYDQFTKRISFYGIDGSFIHSLNIPFFSLKFHAFDNNHYLFNTVNSDNDHFKPIYGYSIFDCDSSFVFKSHGFYRKYDSFSSIINNHNFFVKNNLVYFRPIYNDTIYTISKENVINAKYALNFGNKTVPERFRNGDNSKAYKKALGNQDYMFMDGNFFLTKNYFLFSYMKAYARYDCIYSLSSGKTIAFHNRKGLFPLVFANIIGTTNDAFIGYMFPSMVSQQLEGWKKLPYDDLVKQFGEESVKLGMSMESDENPIITFFYPKKF